MNKIPLYTQTTNDWHCNKNQPNKPYAVDLNVGTNEYTFGRVTPDNKFIVTTGLVKDQKSLGIKMVGGKKIRKNKKGGNVYNSVKTSNSIYNKINHENNELIFNALDKINQLSGLDANRKNSMINASNNISGGSKKGVKKQKKNMKGGKETEGATGMPLQFYNGKMPGKVNEKSSVLPDDSAVTNLAPYNKVGGRKQKKNMKGGKETEGATGMPLQFYNGKMPGKVNEKSSVLPNDSAVTNLAPYSKVGGKKSSTKKPIKKTITKKTTTKKPMKKTTTKKPMKKTTTKKPMKKTTTKKTVKKTVKKTTKK